LGSDLGSSFEHGGRLRFLFGDTWPSPQDRKVDDTDSVAWTTAMEPGPTIQLTFLSRQDADRKVRYTSPVLTDTSGHRLSTTSLEVPIAGFSTNDQMYIFYSTDAVLEEGRGGGLDVFWIGPDRAVGTTWANPSVDSARWQRPFPATPPGAAREASSVAALTRLEGALDVFWIGPDGAVASTWSNPKVNDGNWQPPFPITPPGAAREASSVAALTRLEGALDVFWIGPDGAVASTWSNPKVNDGNWQPPFPITPPGAAREASPVAADTRHNGGHRTLMGRSVLASALNNDPTNLRMLYDVSRLDEDGKFINVAVAKVTHGLPDLPFEGPAMLVWGSGRYRDSDAYLACLPLESVEKPTEWRFFTGLADDGRVTHPRWSSQQREASPLFLHRQIGEVSVSWIDPLGLWLLLYNAATPRGINGRLALTPWGQWSEPIVVFDPVWPGLGYGFFMHRKDGDDGLSDPGRIGEWGGEYGPYMIDRFTREIDVGGQGVKQAQIYFVLSTWNPYNTILMTARIQREQDK
jgi:hypothetical protein